MTDAIQIGEVLPGTSAFEQVIALWRPQAKTLGFMPKGGFEDHAQKRQLLVACEGDRVCGYVMFRRANGRAMIAHLCIAPSDQRRGIARFLVEELSKRTQDCAGIGLKCRREFDASNVWPKLQFVAHDEMTGRGNDGAPLTFWWRDHGKPNLLTVLDRASAMQVVVDANVFYHWVEQSNEESQALQADWLDGMVEFWLTDEIFNEIDRQPNEAKRTANRKCARQFPILPAHAPKEYDRVTEQLRTIISGVGPQSWQSDSRQLVKTVSNHVGVFVTHDAEVLNKADQIFETFGLRVVRPGQLIVKLDALRREEEYQPLRLAGTRYSVQRSATFDANDWTAPFQNIAAGERKAAFCARVTGLLAHPECCEIQFASSPGNEPLAVCGYQYSTAGELALPLFRVAKNSRQATLIRHLLFAAIKRSVSQRCVLTRITDPHLQCETVAALQQEFWKNGADWVNINPADTRNATEVSALLQRIASEHNLEQNTTVSPDSAFWIEKRFWPLKIIDADIPCFIMPIRPKWSKHFFDHILMRDDLFGADDAIAMNRECVYYRRATPKLPIPSSRLLWYVSGDVRQLRAASLVEDVEIAPARDLFRRFKRYGVYRHHHVRETADEDMQNEIMALKFINTESFARPLPLGEMRKIFAEFGLRNQIQSPVRIPSGLYFALYRAAAGMTNG